MIRLKIKAILRLELSLVTAEMHFNTTNLRSNFLLKKDGNSEIPHQYTPYTYKPFT